MLLGVEHHAIRRSQIRRSLVALLIGSVALIFLGTTFAREAIKDYLLRREISRLESEILATRSESERLSDLLGTVTSPTWKEGRARRELNLKRPGERVVVIADELGRVAAARDVEATEEVSNIRKWMDYFFSQR